MKTKIHTLLITNLLPNPEEPTRGIFVARMAAELKKYCDLTLVSPLPWFPGLRFLKTFGRWARYGRIPKKARIEGFDVLYPKHIVVPKIEFIQTVFLFLALLPVVKRIHHARRIDCINVHWAFPDGVAVSWIARLLRIPFVLSAHGCDINDYLRFPLKRAQMLPSFEAASRITVVSDAQRLKLKALGMQNGKVSVVYNGIDTDRFHARDRLECRKKLGLDSNRKSILFVGQFVEVKGFTYLLQAVRTLRHEIGDTFEVWAVGEGPLQRAFEEAVKASGLASRVLFFGVRPHHEIPIWMGASHIFCLPSLREGCPVVVVEALASGLPVVASSVGGIPELVNKTSGILCKSGDVPELTRALSRALRHVWDAERIADSMKEMTWDRAASRYFDEIRSASAEVR